MAVLATQGLGVGVSYAPFTGIAGWLMSIAVRLKQYVRLIVLGAWLGGLGLPAAAVTVDGLYSAQVPVASSSPEDRTQAYSVGLRQVLLRVSGRSDVLELDGASGILGNAESLLQSYQFVRAPDAESGDQLRMMFGPVGVNRALASINAPVWGANRPLTLAWVAVESGGSRILLQSGAQGTGAGWLQTFANAAASRGLPVAFPPSGDNDRRMLSEVWGQFMDSVREASGSYDHDLLALVKIRQQGGQWVGSWSLDGAGVDMANTTVTADSPDQMAGKIVGAWSDRLAQRYAVAAGEVSDAARVDVVVSQVGSMGDYAEVIRALEKMAPVVSANPVRVTRDQMTLKVEISGELAQLEQYVALEPRFVRVESTGTLTSVSRSQPVQAGAGMSPTDGNTPFDGSPSSGPSAPANTHTESQSAGTASAPTPEQRGTPNGEVSYRPTVSDDQPAEETFESLYPTLHYRWQGRGVIAPANASN